jgi:hypothetical protein
MPSKRLCVIGNSHAAAWRLGLAQVPECKEGGSIDFFAARSDLMRHLELREGQLQPTSEVTAQWMRRISGGQAAIDVAAYTHFVIVGLGLNTVKPMEALGGFSVYEAEAALDPQRPLVSDACLAAMTRALVDGSTALHIAALLRKATNAPVLVAPQPYPGEGILQEPGWLQASQSGALQYVTSVFRKVAERSAGELRCDLLWQPEESVVRGGLTAARYSSGSVRLGLNPNAKHDSDENLHMNALYGAEMLRKCLASLA